MRPHFGVVIIALVLLGASAVTAANGAEEYVFVTAWGSGGTGNGQFNLSYGAALDGAGNVYVCDFQNNRVQKFTSSGTFLASWGSYGTANGQFRHPTGVAVDAAGTVYVADHYNHRIQKFTSSGAFLAKWGVYGSADGQMSFPYGIDVDDAGNVYVADYYNARVQKFTSSGAYMMKVGSPGTGNGQFTYPAGVAVDHAGTIYVADQYNHRVQKFGATGSFLAVLGGNGTADDQMRYPTNIAFDSANNAFVADHGHHRVQKFSPAGALITLWGTQGPANGEFWSPTGIAIDSAGTVFVADTNNNRIQVFALNGTSPSPTPTPTTPMPQGPYPSPHAVPGIVEAEDFDAGGEGVAYHDTTAGNLGGAYRPSEGVDIERGGSNYNVGWVRAGEYLEYSVNSTAGGTFRLTLRAANPDVTPKAVKVSLDGAPVSQVGVAGTGGWARYAEFASAPFAVSAGRHILTLSFDGVERVNLDWLRLAAGTATTVTTTTTTTAPTGGAGFVAVPSTVRRGAPVKFTLTPAAGKTVKAAWWSFDAPAHLNTWNSRVTNPTFYYPRTGTFSPLVRITYTDSSVEEVRRPNAVRVT